MRQTAHELRKLGTSQIDSRVARRHGCSITDRAARVTWPNRAQVQATTAVVIISVFLFAAYFALIDAVLGTTINRMFHALATR